VVFLSVTMASRKWNFLLDYFIILRITPFSQLVRLSKRPPKVMGNRFLQNLKLRTTSLRFPYAKFNFSPTTWVVWANSQFVTICLFCFFVSRAGRTSGHFDTTRSSANADNGLDMFSSQSRSTNMVPFWVHCDFSLSM